MKGGAYFGIAGRWRHQSYERGRFSSISSHELGVLMLVFAPIGMKSGEKLVKDQTAREHVGWKTGHRSAGEVLGRTVVIGADICLKAVPGSSSVR